ncbi:hypothetical protein Tco_0674583 [Tanacetum coccineum]
MLIALTMLMLLANEDDIIFGSTKKELCNAFEKLMHEKFQMSSMGELTFFLGLQVEQKKVYLKGQPKLGLWYPKDSPFDLIAYTDSDYAGANLDRKSITGGKAKKSVRLMMEELCKNRQSVWGATSASSLEAEQDSRTKTIKLLRFASLKRRVKKLEKKRSSRTHKLKSLYKVGLSARVESFRDEEDLDIDVDALAAVRKIFVGATWKCCCGSSFTGELKSGKNKDKDKGIMIEEPVVEQVKPMKRLEQMRLDEELSFKLQAKEEEERLTREKAQQIKEASIA